MAEHLAPLMFASLIIVLMIGYPVAFSLAAIGLGFAFIGIEMGLLHFELLQALPERVFGIMRNDTLLAVPFFTLMGLVLERSRMAEELLEVVGQLFGRMRGGLAFAVVLVGALLAATTGVVAASVMAMGLISLPMMLRRGYSPALSSGVIAASGTLAQIIPPSLVLIILADTLSVPVGDMYSGALVPSMMLVGMYLSFLVGVILLRPQLLPAGEAIPWDRALLWRAATQLLPPLALIFLVLGTIFMGLATPTEGSAMGAAGAILLATIRRRLSWSLLFQSLDKTVRLTSFVMMILIGSTVFALVFRALEGDIWVKGLFSHLPGGQISFLLVVNLLVFALGCFIDFFEIVFIVVPLLLPVALAMDIDPVWFGVMLAMNMQTSFLTPPFGFSLFYLRSVAPVALATLSIYRGVIPFIVLQLIMVAVVWEFPHLVSHPPDEHVMFEIDTGALDAAGGGNTHSDDQAIRLMEDIARELRQAESREVPQ